MRNTIASALLLAVTSPAYGTDDLELLKRTAVCVKALLQSGHPLSPIVEVFPAELQSSPPKQCIMVVTERKPNTECPDDFMMGPNLDKGSVACINPTTQAIDHLGFFGSMCPPLSMSESVLESKIGRVRVDF